MASWRFYQGLRNEWRWYHFDPAGDVIAESDQGFAELTACMANAEVVAGFTGDAFQVHTRQTGTETLFTDDRARKKSPKPESWNGSPRNGHGPKKQGAAA